MIEETRAGSYIVGLCIVSSSSLLTCICLGPLVYS